MTSFLLLYQRRLCGSISFWQSLHVIIWILWAIGKSQNYPQCNRLLLLGAQWIEPSYEAVHNSHLVHQFTFFKLLCLYKGCWAYWLLLPPQSSFHGLGWDPCKIGLSRFPQNHRFSISRWLIKVMTWNGSRKLLFACWWMYWLLQRFPQCGKWVLWAISGHHNGSGEILSHFSLCVKVKNIRT